MSQDCESAHDEAKALAEQHGLTLRRCAEGSYQLRQARDGGWIINLYPRTSRGGYPRIYHDRNRPGPFIPCPDEWTFLDVVRGAIKAMEHTAKGTR